MPTLNGRPYRRVGHQGAHAILPGNTQASFDAAIAAGVDMVEFDVLPAGDGQLVLAHDPREALDPEQLTLGDALAHLAAAEVELLVDLKAPGYEPAVLAELRAHGLEARALISTLYPESLRHLRAAGTTARLGLSVPRLQADPFERPLRAAPTLARMAAFRARLPQRAARGVRRGEFHALMAHWRLVTPALVRAVHAADGELYAWTVDDGARVARLAELGVDGIISNDPRLFGAAT